MFVCLFVCLKMRKKICYGNCVISAFVLLLFLSCSVKNVKQLCKLNRFTLFDDVLFFFWSEFEFIFISSNKNLTLFTILILLLLLCFSFILNIDVLRGKNYPFCQKTVFVGLVKEFIWLNFHRKLNADWFSFVFVMMIIKINDNKWLS